MKNNRNQQIAKTIRPLLEKMTCRVYAIFCILLVEEKGFTPEQAEELCELSQAMWMEVNEKNIDIFKWCKEVTGIDMEGRMHEK